MTGWWLQTLGRVAWAPENGAGPVFLPCRWKSPCAQRALFVLHCLQQRALPRIARVVVCLFFPIGLCVVLQNPVSKGNPSCGGEACQGFGLRLTSERL